MTNRVIKSETLHIRIPAELKRAIEREAARLRVRTFDLVRMTLAERCAGRGAEAEVERLQTGLAAEHALMIMYSGRCAAVRRKLQEVGAIARHEEITNLDAIIRLAEAGKEV